MRAQVNSAARRRPAVAQPLPLGLVVEQVARRGGHLVRRRQPGGSAGGVRQRGEVGGDDRRPARHRLEHRQAEALVEARERERLGARVQAGEQALGHRAEVAERVEPLLARELRAVAAGDDDLDVRGPAATSARRFLRAVWEATQRT